MTMFTGQVAFISQIDLKDLDLFCMKRKEARSVQFLFKSRQFFGLFLQKAFLGFGISKFASSTMERFGFGLSHYRFFLLRPQSYSI